MRTTDKSPAFEAFDDLLTRRRSCRAFRPDPLPRALIEIILLAAQKTASWCNVQPWQVLIVDGAPLEHLREALVAAGDGAAAPDLDWPREYRGLHQQRRRDCGWALYQAVGVSRGDRAAAAQQAAENHRLFGAPHLAVVGYDGALGTHGAVDCGAWVSNFMLAAASVGVASIAQAALAGHAPLLRDQLGLPTDRTILCGISFGRADEAHPANSFRLGRAPLAENIAWSVA